MQHSDLDTCRLIVSATDLVGASPALLQVVRRRAKELKVRDVSVELSDDGAELTVECLLDNLSYGEAREVGHAILDAVEAREFVWQVGVSRAFSGI